MAEQPKIDWTFKNASKCYGYNKPTHICLHYTAGSTQPTARAIANYFCNTSVQASSNLVVGDDGIYGVAPLCYGSWAQGNRGANMKCISIEVCRPSYDTVGYTSNEKAYLKQLIPWLMEKYGIPKGNIIRHYDVVDRFSGWSSLDPHKRCPWAYAPNQIAWLELVEEITKTKEWDEMATESEVKNAAKNAFLEAIKVKHKVSPSSYAKAGASGETTTQAQIDYIDGKQNAIMERLDLMCDALKIEHPDWPVK